MTFFSKPVLFLFTVLCVVNLEIRAQVCQGSLGDPLVNITFGAGANPGPPLAAAATSYQYIAGDCPNDGFYTVRSNTSNCFSASWHDLATDHTGEPNGYFMLVNASYQTGTFYLDTVKGLCTGTTYEFAAWVTSVLKSSACNGAGIQPNLDFTIEKTDGTVLNTYTTGNIANLGSPTWQQYGFFFATPVGVSDIVLKIANRSPGGCGNDIALDDITFRPCGPQLNIGITGITEKNVTICEGTTYSFTLGGSLGAGFTNALLQWQTSVNGGPWTDIIGAPGNASYLINFPATTLPGIYAYRLSAAEAGNINTLKCRVASQPVTIKVATVPVTTATINAPQCEKSTLLLSAGGGTDYQWTGPNGFTASGASVSIPGIEMSDAGKYYVLVKNADGCTHLDSVIATINANPVAVVPFADTRICEGDNITLGSSGGISYEWFPVTGLSSADVSGPVARPTDTITYHVVVTNQFSCRDTADITVNVVERPRANAGPDQYVIKGNPTQLLAEVSGQHISYSWSPPVFMDNPLALQPMVTPLIDTNYLLTVVSNEGCGTATDIVWVYVYPDIYIPNVFSPNNDGYNDTWSIPALRAYSEFTIAVYNRAGQLIFYTKNNAKPWDGKYKGLPQPADGYVYVVELKKEKKLFKGTLLIVR